MATLSSAAGYRSATSAQPPAYPSGHLLQYSYAQGQVSSLGVDGQAVLTGALYQPFANRPLELG